LIKIKIIYLLLGVLSLTKILFAQGPPIYTDTPVLFGLDGRGIRTFGKYISKENVNVYAQPLAVPINLGADIQVGAIAPYMIISPKNMQSVSGFGDISVFVKYVFQQKDSPGKTFRTLIKFMETFPTGSTAQTPSLGSGINQTYLGLVSGYITLNYGIYGELGYTLVSDNKPDNFLYAASIGIPLLPQEYPPHQMNIYFGFNGNYEFEVKKNVLYLSPGVQYIAGKKILFETGVQLPVIEDVPSGFKTNYGFTFGTRILLF
jgi:hypothetical protein